MERNKIKHEIDGVLDYYMYEYSLSKEEAKIPTAQIYIYLYLDGSINAGELVDALDEIRLENSYNKNV